MDKVQNNSAPIHIKRYGNEDLRLVKEFYERSYQGDLNRKIVAFRWMAENNPFIDQGNNYVLVLKDGKVVGYCGSMPMRFYLNGQPFMAIFGQEILVDPSVRKQGLATTLLREIKYSNCFWISLWFNENVLSILQKEGKLNIGYFRPLKKIFKIESLFRVELKERIKNRIIENILLKLARRYHRLRHEKKREKEQYDVEGVETFDSRYDEFFLRLAGKFKLISDRTSQTLIWKYIDIPHRQFRAFCVRKNGNLVGYIILGIEHQEHNIKKGIIADLLIDPEEVEGLKSLLRISDRFFIENGVDFSVCHVSSPIFRSVMRKQGYYEGKQVKCDCLLIYNEKLSPNPEIVKDINNWYFTYGDSDYTMW